MVLKEFIQLFERDLDRLAKEIELYSNSENLWKTAPGISNSSGNLCMHLLGNLRAFVCKEMGGFDYIRDREREFNAKGIDTKDLLEEIYLVKKQLEISLEGLDESILNKSYPLEVFGEPMTYGYFLIHLYGHFNYHLGQINYCRRLLES
ncbi:DinB family protein [Algoriphagus sp. CAU 1675]|uniref:DinB family protein n=1 Tax=Algoriphagus sp. CAU 1675 TaxID=3032597 RepID=UPI0023DAE3D2|nr:DinB family protein [Algoriphagus sp. CAU 1675]MDF2158019.1 DinB family protein [Algoriphagus sp. CAU 1675]